MRSIVGSTFSVSTPIAHHSSARALLRQKRLCLFVTALSLRKESQVKVLFRLKKFNKFYSSWSIYNSTKYVCLDKFMNHSVYGLHLVHRFQIIYGWHNQACGF